MPKPILSFYGGKQRLKSKILPHIKITQCYVEPFFGGGTIFFGKEKYHGKDRSEIINDVNDNLINFYRYAQSYPEKLIEELKKTLFAESSFLKAKLIFQNPDKYSDLERALAVFLGYSMSFSNSGFDKGFGVSAYRSKSKEFFNKINWHLSNSLERLKDASIVCQDALKVIKKFDRNYTFFYCDPPYFNADCSPYKTIYLKEDFQRLINTLEGISGSAAVSCYPNDCINLDKWKIIEFRTSCSSANQRYKHDRDRKEWLCLLLKK